VIGKNMTILTRREGVAWLEREGRREREEHKE
jgi:hypothetical protein